MFRFICIYTIIGLATLGNSQRILLKTPRVSFSLPCCWRLIKKEYSPPIYNNPNVRPPAPRGCGFWFQNKHKILVIWANIYDPHYCVAQKKIYGGPLKIKHKLVLGRLYHQGKYGLIRSFRLRGINMSSEDIVSVMPSLSPSVVETKQLFATRKLVELDFSYSISAYNVIDAEKKMSTINSLFTLIKNTLTIDKRYP